MSEIKRVYRFGGRDAEGDGSMRNLLGGKGANLAEMCKLGIPVPAGFTITTECCTEYYKLGTQYPKELKAEVDAALAATEAIMGKKFNAGHDGDRAQHRSLFCNNPRYDCKDPESPIRI